MTLSIFDKFITQTSSGETIPNALLQVNNTGASSGPAQLWQDAAGTIFATNPFVADGFGRVQFYLTPGKYDMQASSGGAIVDYPDVLVSSEDQKANRDIFIAGVDFTAGVTTELTLSAAPNDIDNTIINFDGSFIGPESYSLAGDVITFNDPINISVDRVYVWFGTALSSNYGDASSISLTVDGAGTNVSDYLNAQFVDDLAELRVNLAAGDYGVGAVVFVKSTGDHYDVVDNSSSTYTDGDNYSLVESSQAAVKSKSFYSGITSTAIASGALNARLCVVDRTLYLCEYDNHKIGIYDLSTPATPRKTYEFTTKFLPRHVEVYQGFLFVACTGNFAVEVYDISRPESVVLVGEFAVREQPKMFEIIGDTIFVVSFTTGYVEKFRFTLPISGGTEFSQYKVGEVAVSTQPLGISYNGAGLLCVSGIAATIDIIDADTLTLLSSTSIGTGTKPTSQWITTTQILLANSTGQKLLSVNCENPASPLLTSSATSSGASEQIEIVGNLAYMPTLSGPGLTSYLDIFDISNPTAPTYVTRQALSVGGAGFTAVYQDEDRAYIYVSGHYTPFNIDAKQIARGKLGIWREPSDKGMIKSVAASQASFGNAYFNHMQLAYRTETGTYIVANTDPLVLRCAGNTVTLGPPANFKVGHVQIIQCVASRVDVVNPYDGFKSRTLFAQEAIVVQMTDLNAWDVVATFTDPSYTQYYDTTGAYTATLNDALIYAGHNVALNDPSVAIGKILRIVFTASASITTAYGGYAGGAYVSGDVVLLHARAGSWTKIN